MPNANKGNPTATLDASSLAMIRLVTGFWVSRAIYIAAQLGIADLLKDESKEIGELAKVTGTHASSLYRVMRTLASIGIFAENDGRRFALTPLADTLRSDVPASLRAWVNVQLGEEHYRAWGDPMHTVQTGESAFHHVFGMGVWEYRAQHPEHAKVFDQAMANLTEMYNTVVLSSYRFSSFEKIVDVGAGDGGLLMTILEANPNAKGVLFDLPHVAEKARQRITSAGLAGRCQVVAGDVFSSVPDGGDAYILSRVIHNWDNARSTAILKNCHRAMVSDGRLLLIEGVVRSGNEPDLTKLFDLNMMMLSGGRERTAAEYQAILNAAGFALERMIPTQSVMDIGIIECTREKNHDRTR